jgi:hypothetical protein
MLFSQKINYRITKDLVYFIEIEERSMPNISMKGNF